MYDFVESYDSTTGKIIYKKPNIGIINMHACFAFILICNERFVSKSME